MNTLCIIASDDLILVLAIVCIFTGWTYAMSILWFGFRKQGPFLEGSDDTETEGNFEELSRRLPLRSGALRRD
jgi:hypothetical protein